MQVTEFSNEWYHNTRVLGFCCTSTRVPVNFNLKRMTVEIRSKALFWQFVCTIVQIVLLVINNIKLCCVYLTVCTTVQIVLLVINNIKLCYVYLTVCTAVQIVLLVINNQTLCCVYLIATIIFSCDITPVILVTMFNLSDFFFFWVIETFLLH